MKIKINDLKKIIIQIINENKQKEKFEIVFLIGPPAVGKSTFINKSKYKDYPVLSHDAHVLSIARKYSDPASGKYVYSDNIHKDKDEEIEVASERRKEATQSFLSYREKIISTRFENGNKNGILLDLTNTTRQIRKKQKRQIVALLLNKDERDVTAEDEKNNTTTTGIVFADKPKSSNKNIYSEEQKKKIIKANKDRYEFLDKKRVDEENKDQEKLNNKESIDMENREGDIKNVPEEFILKIITNMELPERDEFDEVYFVGVHPDEEKIKELNLD